LKIYQEFNKEAYLPNKHGFYQKPARSTDSDLSDFINKLKSKKLKRQRYTNTAFNDKPWTHMECFQYATRQIYTESTTDYIVTVIEELESFRNSFAHGNFHQFVRQKFNNYKFKDQFLVSLDGSEIEKIDPDFTDVPDIMIIQHFFNTESKKVTNSDLEMLLKRVFIHTTYFLHNYYRHFYMRVKSNYPANSTIRLS
jgi:hypothetical protein